MKHTPGPWIIEPRVHAEMFASVMGSDGHLIVNLGDGGNGIERQTANAALIAMAPEMAEFLSRMRCNYKAPEVANEVCGHCIVCRAKKIEGVI